MSLKILSLDLGVFSKPNSTLLSISDRSALYRVRSDKTLSPKIASNSDYILKIYSQKHLRGLNDSMRSHLELIQENLPLNKSYFESRMALPLASLQKDGKFIGFVMNDISRFSKFELVHHSGKREKVLSELKFFLNSYPERKRLGVPNLSNEVLLGLANDFLATLALLHEQKLIVGDISYSNLIVARRPNTKNPNRILFLDVDSFRHVAKHHPLGSESTPNWWAPEQLAKPASASTMASDVYKACLVIRRMLHHTSPSPTDSYSLKKSEVEGRFLRTHGGHLLHELIARGLEIEHSERPKMQEISYEFKSFVNNYENAIS